MTSYHAEVHPLSMAFMNAYPPDQFPELLHKRGRPYSCLLVDTHTDYYICIPFRSHITHRNSFLFHGTERSRRTKSGLDYTKIVIINKASYIDGRTAVVDQDEYNEMQRHLSRIVQDATAYVGDYIAHITGSVPLHPREFARRYQFSTLRYFHDILGISSAK